jgi:putative ABC transport system permease protein
VRASSLWTLVRRDVVRSGGALGTAGFGIMAGTGSLVFFLALGLAVRAVLLGDVFPIDRVELEPVVKGEPELLALLVGGGKAPPGISQQSVARLAALPGVVGVYPKLRFAFPSGAFGGKELLGQEVGTHEMLADGVEPALVAGDVKGPFAFDDPLRTPGAACKADDECKGGQYCELPSEAPAGQCSEPIPVLVSPFLVEIFNKGIAPAHNLPQVGMSLLSRAQGVTFRLQLGVSMMGRAKRGTPRSARARVVGISRSAIDLGVTLPLEVVRRLNREYAGPEAAERYSSVLVRVAHPADITRVVAQGAVEAIEPKDTRARDVSVLITGIMALLSLVSGVILVVAASNIAFTFRVLVGERRAEIGLYRALGATPADIGAWVLSLSAVVGLVGGLGGVAVARVGALVVDYLAATRLPDFPFKPETFFAFPAWLVGAGALGGALFAVVGALSAVRQAARLDPSRALIER